MKGNITTGAKIIFVPFIDGFGGVERLVLALSRYLSECNAEHLVLCFRDSIGLERHADWPLHVEQLGANRNMLSEMWHLRKWLSRSAGAEQATEPFLAFDLKGAFYAIASPRPYVLHLTDPPSLLPADTSKYAPSAAARLGVVSARPVWSPSVARSRIVHSLNSKGVRKAARVMAMTKAIADEILLLYEVSACIVRPGVPILEARAPSRTSSEFRLLSVSRLEESKRIAWIIRALRDLEASHPPLHSRFDWRLDIVGEGPAANDLKALSNALQLAQRVTFCGRISDDDLKALYGSAHIFIMPAIQGYGLPALEALSRRIPVIVHRASGVSEILSGSPWVEVIDSDRGEDLAEAIMTMMTRSATGQLDTAPLPRIPSDSQWAEEVCRICGWSDVG